MSEFERITEWSAAFDKRHADPKKNYGIHGVECRWILKGPKGAVQFLLYTNWQLPHVTREQMTTMLASDPIGIKVKWCPLPADLGYHSPHPMYEGHQPIGDQPCPYIDAPCYYDGSGLRAEDVYNILVEQGGEAVWEYMENEYNSLFGEKP